MPAQPPPQFQFLERVSAHGPQWTSIHTFASMESSSWFSSSNCGSNHLANKLNDSKVLESFASHCNVRKVMEIILVSPPFLWNHFELADEELWHFGGLADAQLLQDLELEEVVPSRLVIVDDASWVVNWWTFFRGASCFNSWAGIRSRVERDTLLILVYLNLR